MKFPTIQYPLILEIQNRVHGDIKAIPALKNRREFGIGKNGVPIFKKSKAVKQFNKYAESLIDNTLKDVDFDFPIPIPRRVIMWVKFVRYVSNLETLPVSDLDNQYTTIQELLEVDILENDKQVSAYYVEEELTTIKDSQYAIVFLWVDDERAKFTQMKEFFDSFKPNTYEEQKTQLPDMLVEMMKFS